VLLLHRFGAAFGVIYRTACRPNRVATHVATQTASGVTERHLADCKRGWSEPKRPLAERPGPTATAVRDREAPGSNPGPPTNFEFKIADFGRRRKTVGRREVTAVSQIFLELGRGMDCGPSIELAHAYRTADISARARPRDRETPGFRIPRPLVSTKPRAINTTRTRIHGAY
jgi:hypothetical protein